MLSKGTEVAGYRIDRVIDAGPTGTTYLARNPDMPRDDALTIIGAELSRDPGFRERFTRAAEAAEGLSHPGIAGVYGHGTTDDGLSWLATQIVDGTDADTALRQGSMTPARAVRIVSQVAMALDYAHRRGVLHGNVRPANFLLPGDSDDRAVLSHFGTLEPRDSASEITYAAPEVLRGNPVDPRADLYSLGGSLFRLLTGRTPFPERDDPAATLGERLHTPKVTDFAGKLPAALDAIVAKAMADNPDDRYQTGEEFAAALTAILPRQHSASPVAPVVTPPPVLPTPTASPVVAPTPPPAYPPSPVPVPTPPPANPAPAPPFAAPSTPPIPTPPPPPSTTRPPSPSPSPSWHPSPDVEPSDPRGFPDPVVGVERPGRRPLKVGAAALGVAAVAAGGVFWLTSSRDAENGSVAREPTTSTSPTDTQTTSRPPATRDSGAEAALRRLLPAGYASDACSPADPDRGARATLVCTPNRDAGGPTAGRYSLLPDLESLQRAFNALVAESSTEICPGNIMSPGAWRHNATPQQVAGTVFCGSKGDERLVAWTTDDKLLLNVATSKDEVSSLDQLFAWWGSHS